MMFPGCIWPSKTNPRTPEDLKRMRGFVAYVADALQHLRSQVRPKNAPQPTWNEICLNVVRPIVELLSTTDIEVYCYCLDALGDIRRVEKRETDNKRYGSKPKPVVTPYHDGSYTCSDKSLAIPMNEFFKDKRARIALYLDLIEFFKSDEVRASIPDGKSIVFSGAIELVPSDNAESRYDSWQRVAPLCITRKGVSVIEEIDCDAVCEGDLQVFQMAIWLMRFYPRKGNIMIYSKDGDIPMYAILMLRVFLKINRSIKIYCKTERAATLDTTSQKRKAEDEDESTSKRGSAAASSSSSTRRKSEFQVRYINICSMVQRMSEEASDLNQKLPLHTVVKSQPKDKRNQMKVVAAGAEWVAATLISSSSHDYLDPQDYRYGAVDRFAMRAFPWWRHYFTPLVKVSRRLRTAEDLLPEDTPHHHVYYVNVANVDRYIDFCYYEKVYDTLQKKGEISVIDHDDVPGDELQEFDPDIMKKAKKLRKTNEAISLRKLHERLTKAKKERRLKETELEGRIQTAQSEEEKKCMKKELSFMKRRHAVMDAHNTPFPTQRERLVAGCARLAWVLHYGGVGGIQESVVVDGTKVDPSTGLSLHGFYSEGFDWRVCGLDSEWRKCG